MATKQAIAAQQRLLQISKSLQDKAEFRGLDGKVRHKCFLSYHVDDAEEALEFVTTFDSVFIPRAIGISDDAPWIDSDDTGYIMQKIRDDYLRDSTVTIVLVGRCTWARKFIDWEVYSTLRNDTRNRLSGLLAIRLTSTSAARPTLPGRVDERQDGIDLLAEENAVLAPILDPSARGLGRKRHLLLVQQGFAAEFEEDP